MHAELVRCIAQRPTYPTAMSAVTLATRDMAGAVRFYRALGFELHYGGEDATFTSFKAGASYLNLVATSSGRRWAG